MSRARSLAAATGLALAVLALSGCGSDARTGSIAAIDVQPGQVASVTFTADGRTATFTGRDGGFEPAAGADREFATELSTVSGRLFPLNSYRILSDVDVAEPAYGLLAATAGAGLRPDECGSGCSMQVRSLGGRTWRVSVGGRSFNSAGYYATVEGDPKVYLLIAQSVSDMITFATGRRFEFPPTQQLQELEVKTAQLDELAQGQVRAEADQDAFLRQVLAAEQDRKAAAQGKPGGALVKASTSTQDQLGSTPVVPGSAAPPDQQGSGR